VRASIASGAVAAAALFAVHAAANELNRHGIDPTLVRDERGMSLFLPEGSRTPSGLLYEPPYEIRRPLRLGNEWSTRVSAEFGVVDSDGDARLRNYADYRSGFLLNYFSFGLDRPSSAHYIDVTAGAVGRDDQYWRASGGRHGSWHTNLYFNQTPTLLSDQARTVFHGAGSGNLTLAPGLTPGDNTPAQIDAALRSAAPFELGFVRKKAGLDIDVTPEGGWRYYARYTQDRKVGTRPSGGASSYPGFPFAETIEPIDYKTHDVFAGVQWAGEVLQVNLAYAGSFFRNGIDTLTWENPLLVGDPAVMQRGRTDLYPDNNFHNLKLDLSAALPLRGRLSGGVSVGRMTQDDELVAPTVNSGMIGFPPTDLANWNTTGALSRKSAGARIDTLLTHLSGSFSPLRDLSLQAKWRRYEEENKTRYEAFNPQTGETGYVGLDGSVVNTVPNNFFSVQLRSIPFECMKDSYGADVDYRVLRRTNVTLGYERENNECRYRESARTEEGRVRAALNNRDLSWATIRLSYEHARRTGDQYNSAPSAAFYAPSAFFNTPQTLAELRKYDLAERDQDVVNARVNFLLSATMDLAVSGKIQDNDYRAAYGRLEDRSSAVNLEWNWQPRPTASAYVHYGFERRRNRMALINDDPAGWLSGDASAGGAVYPFANQWTETSQDDTYTVGLGFRYTFGRATLESGYAYLYSPYRTRYSFASSDALAGGAAAAADAGEGMPDIKFRRQTLDASLRFALDKNSALRVVYTYERARFEDWHYDGLPLVLGSEAVFLGAGPRNYTASLIGLLYQYSPGGQEKTR
jgi:MtrB/PioB family decaheme-associated outer membrane protein